MGAFLYTRPDQNVAPNATITTSGVVSDYPVAGLVDSNPGVPSKLSGTSGWWVMDFGGAQRVDLVALVMTNLDPGLANVRVQAHTANSWGAPSMDVAVTIPARRLDGTPTNVPVVLIGRSGYSASGYRYWRLNFATANSVGISIGEFPMYATYGLLPYGLAPGAVRASRRRRVKHETDGGELLAYDLGVTQRSVRGEVQFKDTAKADVDAWLEASKGDLRPFLVVPNTDVADAWWVTHASEELPQTRIVLGMNSMPLDLVEVGAGIPA
jgi:hypothetical protein